MTAKRRISEIGVERYCRKCADWWPDDDEFWVYWGTPKQACKACHRQYQREYQAKLRAQVLPTQRTIMGPAICRHCEQFVLLKTNPDRRRKALVWEHV